MLRSAKELQGYSLYGSEGPIADVDQFFFDDRSWVVRYVVVRPGILSARALILPGFITGADHDADVLYTELNSEAIENSPGIEADRPVSAQQEIEFHTYYGVGPYWEADPLLLEPPTYPMAPPMEPTESLTQGDDPHLRSTSEVFGYRIHATDGEIGHVEDFVVDEEGWAIRYIGVDTRNWLPGRKVVVAPQWLAAISWAEAEVYVRLSREQIRNSPEWDPETPIDREYEKRLYDHYGFSPYWE